MTALKTTAIRIPAGGVLLNADMALPARAEADYCIRPWQRQWPAQYPQSLCCRNPERIRICNTACRSADGRRGNHRFADAATALRYSDAGGQAGRHRSMVTKRTSNEASKDRLVRRQYRGGRRINRRGPTPGKFVAVVSRGGRPDLAGDYLSEVMAPVLLIVGENDPQVLDLINAHFAA